MSSEQSDAPSGGRSDVGPSPDPRPDGDIEAFKNRATTGAVWTVLGFGGRQTIRLIANLILTRLLLEEHFGLMALVTVVLVGVNLFSDIGISAALIQNERDDASFVNTIWTIGMARGVALWIVASILAVPVAKFYDQPVLVDLIRVGAFASVIEGFKSTNYHTANRHLHMKGIVMLEIGAQLTGIAVMITWASVSRSVWALVAGGLAGAAMSTVWSYFLPGPRNRLRFEKEAAVTLYRFGRWIFLSTVLTFLVLNSDRIIFGKLVTMAALGVYSIAVNLASLPAAAMGHISAAIIFPVYSRFHHGGTDMLPIYRNARLPMLILGGWATAGLVAGGPTIIQILYDPRYWEAGWMLQALAAGLWFGEVLEGSNGVALLALGHSRWLAIASVAKIVGMAVFIPLGWHWYGFPGAVLGFAGADLLRYFASVAGVLCFDLDGRTQDVRMTSLVAVSAFVGWLAVQLLTAAGWTNVFFHALVIAVLVTAFWTPQLLKVRTRYKQTGHVFFADPG